MARITVEDCLENVANRFSLVLVAAERTKQLLKGENTLLEAEIEQMQYRIKDVRGPAGVDGVRKQFRW